jgi:hypothetical protein
MSHLSTLNWNLFPESTLTHIVFIWAQDINLADITPLTWTAEHQRTTMRTDNEVNISWHAHVSQKNAKKEKPKTNHLIWWYMTILT